MRKGSDPSSILSAILFMMGGPILWSLHFFLVYGPQSAVCGMNVNGIARIDPALATTSVIVATAGIGMLLLAAAWRPGWVAALVRFRADEPERGFSFRLARLLVLLSLVGVVLAGAAALLIDPCAQLR
jgi:hypothetical protein